MTIPQGYKQTELGIIPEDWEVVNLGNVAKVNGRIGFRGYTVADLVPKGFGAITLSPSNIINNQIDYSNCTYISWYKYHESPEIKVRNGDILLVKTGSTFGKSAFVKDLPEKATINPQFVLLNNFKCDSRYLSYVIAHDIIQNQIHADIVGGIVAAKEPEVYAKLRNAMVNFGGNMDPHQAYLVIRGLKTLGIRVDRAQENAKKVAEYLSTCEQVEWVKYPGLTNHPQYDLAKKQMKGPGTMISFSLKGGLEAGRTLMDNVKMAILAVSLGGVETLIQHPASMTHSKVPKESREQAGITDGLVRFSVGIENVEDIINDLKQAMAKIK
mgnify:CR=1 FL=1